MLCQRCSAYFFHGYCGRFQGNIEHQRETKIGIVAVLLVSTSSWRHLLGACRWTGGSLFPSPHALSSEQWSQHRAAREASVETQSRTAVSERKKDDL